MQLIQHISMDLAVHGITPRIFGKQDDSGAIRAVAISLFNAGAAYPISDSTGFMVGYKSTAGGRGLYDALPDGTSAFTVTGNTVTVALVDHIFAKVGDVECDLRIIEPTGSVSTWSWIIEVDRKTVPDTTLPSDYINVLSAHASAAVKAAAEARAAAASLDTSALMKLSEYDSSGEVKAAGGIVEYVKGQAANEETEMPVTVESLDSYAQLDDYSIEAYTVGKFVSIMISATILYPSGTLASHPYAAIRIKGLPVQTSFHIETVDCTFRKADSSSTSGGGYVSNFVADTNGVKLSFAASIDATPKAGDAATFDANLLLLSK